MNDFKYFINIDELEKNMFYCPFCYSTRVYPAVVKNIKVKNKNTPHQEIKIQNVNIFYCVDCKTAYTTKVDEIIQQCKNVSGDPEFYPESAEVNIDV
ncbi:hypothetical protein [Faecalibacterium prausnitzii]|jgi:hypothetical protein|uniref:hypothetical protein n=1 Tax=Faecalibacterium prausnitzii TaxID=853 RepID=UPI0022E85FA1|nr:hypothetical protein [Faecalibacterium prausnitzii]